MLATLKRWFLQSTVDDARDKARKQRATPEERQDAIAVALLVKAAGIAATKSGKDSGADEAGILLMAAAAQIAAGLFNDPRPKHIEAN